MTPGASSNAICRPILTPNFIRRVLPALNSRLPIESERRADFEIHRYYKGPVGSRVTTPGSHLRVGPNS